MKSYLKTFIALLSVVSLAACSGAEEDNGPVYTIVSDIVADVPPDIVSVEVRDCPFQGTVEGSVMQISLSAPPKNALSKAGYIPIPILIYDQAAREGGDSKWFIAHIGAKTADGVSGNIALTNRTQNHSSEEGCTEIVYIYSTKKTSIKKVTASTPLFSGVSASIFGPPFGGLNQNNEDAVLSYWIMSWDVDLEKGWNMIAVKYSTENREPYHSGFYCSNEIPDDLTWKWIPCQEPLTWND